MMLDLDQVGASANLPQTSRHADLLFVNGGRFAARLLPSHVIPTFFANFFNLIPYVLRELCQLTPVCLS